MLTAKTLNELAPFSEKCVNYLNQNPVKVVEYGHFTEYKVNYEGIMHSSNADQRIIKVHSVSDLLRRYPYRSLLEGKDVNEPLAVRDVKRVFKTFLNLSQEREAAQQSLQRYLIEETQSEKDRIQSILQRRYKDQNNNPEVDLHELDMELHKPTLEEKNEEDRKRLFNVLFLSNKISRETSFNDLPIYLKAILIKQNRQESLNNEQRERRRKGLTPIPIEKLPHLTMSEALDMIDKIDEEGKRMLNKVIKDKLTNIMSVETGFKKHVREYNLFIEQKANQIINDHLNNFTNVDEGYCLKLMTNFLTTHCTNKKTEIVNL